VVQASVTRSGAEAHRQGTDLWQPAMELMPLKVLPKENSGRWWH